MNTNRMKSSIRGFSMIEVMISVVVLGFGLMALAAYLGRLDFTGMREADLFQVPMPLHFGLSRGHLAAAHQRRSRDRPRHPVDTSR